MNLHIAKSPSQPDIKGKVFTNLDHSPPFYRDAYRILKKTGSLKQAIFKSDVPYRMLYEKYGRLLDSITFMPDV